MKTVKEYHVVDNLYSGDTEFTKAGYAEFYAGGIRIGYLRAASIITEKVESLSASQKVAIYEIMDEAFKNIKTITIESEVKE